MSNEDAKRILLVEDEDNLRELVRGRLESNGYQVAAAEDGYKALELVREFKPDLVILDLMLPKMDGYSVCRMLRSGVADEKLPIILFSARSSDDDRRRGIDSGASAYVSKPFDPPVLLAKIRELIDPEAWTAEQAQKAEKDASKPAPEAEPVTPAKAAPAAPEPAPKAQPAPAPTPQPAPVTTPGPAAAKAPEQPAPAATPQPVSTAPLTDDEQAARARPAAPETATEPVAGDKPQGFFARLFGRLFRPVGSK